MEYIVGDEVCVAIAAAIVIIAEDHQRAKKIREKPLYLLNTYLQNRTEILNMIDELRVAERCLFRNLARMASSDIELILQIDKTKRQYGLTTVHQL